MADTTATSFAAIAAGSSSSKAKRSKSWKGAPGKVGLLNHFDYSLANSWSRNEQIASDATEIGDAITSLLRRREMAGGGLGGLAALAVVGFLFVPWLSGIASEPSNLQELAVQRHNPLTEELVLPFEFSTSLDVGPGNGTAEGLSIQPRIPVSLGKNWRLIERPQLSLLHNLSNGEKYGVGDLELQSYLTPARADKWIWGLGPIFQFPTASDPSLGTGKWSAGPNAGLVYLSGPWANAVLVSHVWSFGGDQDRQSVSFTSFEPIASYNSKSGWSVSSDLAMSYDWQAAHGKKWSVPLGMDFGKAFQLGSVPISWQFGTYYYFLRQEGAADWLFRLQLSFTFPKK